MDDTKMNKQLGTKWFTFYTKVRPWFICVATLSAVVDFAQYVDVYVGNWWLLLSFIATVTHPILSIIVMVKSSKDYIDFVRFVKGVLLFEVIDMSFQQGVQQYIKNDFDIEPAVVTALLMLLISYFVWYRLNVKYFEKRAVIGPCKSAEVITNLSQKRFEDKVVEISPDSDKIRFCRKCGEELIDNSKFCRKCGMEIITEPIVVVDEPGVDINTNSVCEEPKGVD